MANKVLNSGQVLFVDDVKIPIGCGNCNEALLSSGDILSLYLLLALLALCIHLRSELEIGLLRARVHRVISGACIRVA